MEELTEHEMYVTIAHWLQVKYPNVIYRFDLASDMLLTPGQARRHKILHPKRGYPDLFIAEPRSVLVGDKEGTFKKSNYNVDSLGVTLNNEHLLMAHGLFLEIKKAETRMKKKDGSWASPHIEEQAQVLQKLRDVNYCAEFAVGLDETYKIISKYMEGKK